MSFRFVAWTIEVRNKSGGSSSEWVWEASRRPVPFVTLGTLVGFRIGEVQEALERGMWTK